MASMMHFWARSVRWYLTMAEMTEGFSPRSMPVTVSLAAAPMM